jgi:hypothetical protein
MLIGCLFLYQLALAQAHYHRVLPEQQPFPIEDYDAGRPLSPDFYTQAISGSLHEPAFLVESKPTIWSEAAPPIHTGLRILRGKALDSQDAATFISCALALGIILAAGLGIAASHRGSIVGAMPTRLMCRISAALIAWVLIASVIFAGTGP